MLVVVVVLLSFCCCCCCCRRCCCCCCLLLSFCCCCFVVVFVVDVVVVVVVACCCCRFVVVLFYCCFVVVVVLKNACPYTRPYETCTHFQGQYRRLFKRQTHNPQTHNPQTLSTLPRTHMTSRSHGKHLPRTYEGLAEVNSGFQRPLHDDSDIGDTGSIIHRRNQCLLRASSLSSVNTDCWFQVTQIVVQEMKNDLRRRGRVALRDLG